MRLSEPSSNAQPHPIWLDIIRITMGIGNGDRPMKERATMAKGNVHSRYSLVSRSLLAVGQRRWIKKHQIYRDHNNHVPKNRATQENS